MSNRCSICDHLEGHGSTFLNTYDASNKVRWRPQVSEFLCDSCAEEITITIQEYERPEVQSFEEGNELVFAPKPKYLAT